MGLRKKQKIKSAERNMTREKSIITDCINRAFLFPVIAKTRL